LERGLDTMVLVYSVLNGHPASVACEQLLRNHTGWFTPTLLFLEAKAILTKVYGVSAALASHKLTQVAAQPVTLVAVDSGTAQSALTLADTTGVDLMDAVLLRVAQQVGAGWVATEDQALAKVCSSLGLSPLSPLDPILRQQVAAWEAVICRPRDWPVSCAAYTIG
jgi:predicted nucleic acid-binding protein